MDKIRILLADDHQIVTEGLRRLLEPTYELVAIAKNGHEMIAAAKELQPDVIIVDISMPLLNGIDAVSEIRSAGIQTKIIYLTMHPEANYARRALATGASAYVLKHSASSELLFAIQQALAGRHFISPAVAEKIDSPRTPEDVSLDTLDGLTVRQREVLQLLAEGYSAKEVSAVLEISRRTVEYHKYRIMKILGLRKSAELIQFAVQHGLILQSLTPHSRRQRLKNQ
jgi:DNA-binding NarL/FixJ family response regulator